MAETYLHPETVAQYGNLAADHLTGPLAGFRQVFGPEWVSNYLATIYRVLIGGGNITAVTVDSTIGASDTTASVRYTLTTDAPDLP